MFPNLISRLPAVGKTCATVWHCMAQLTTAQQSLMVKTPLNVRVVEASPILTAEHLYLWMDVTEQAAHVFQLSLQVQSLRPSLVIKLIKHAASEYLFF